MRVRCGWCGKVTPDGGACLTCRRDPHHAWHQRGTTAPVIPDDEGRPPLSSDDVRSRYTAAKAALVARGRTPTVEAIAEELDRSPRTVRDWRKRFGLA
jgi:hypothetical protein